MSYTRKPYALNVNQVHLLKLLFKFRLLTSGLLARYKNIHRVNAKKTLDVLVNRGYVGVYFDKSYKLLGMSGRYYLTPLGITYLKDKLDFDPKALHNMYKNRSVSQNFIDHHIATGEVFLHFYELYPHKFEIFTRSETQPFEAFPAPRPDLYLRKNRDNSEYFIELHHDTPPKNARKRLDQLIEHYDQEGWDKDTYPTLLFVLTDARTEGYFIEYAKSVLDATGMEDEITILTSTLKALTSRPYSQNVWTHTKAPSEPTKL